MLLFATSYVLHGSSMFSFQPQILDPFYAPVFSAWTGSMASIHSKYEKLHYLSTDSLMEKQNKHDTAQENLRSLQQDSINDLSKSSLNSEKGVYPLSTSVTWPSALCTLPSPSQSEKNVFNEPMPFETSKSSMLKYTSHEGNNYQMDNETDHKDPEEEHLSILNTDTFLVCDMLAVVDMEEESTQSCLETPLAVIPDTPSSSLPSSPPSTSSKSGHVMIDTEEFKPPPLITLNTTTHSPANAMEYIQLQDQQNSNCTRKPQSPLVLNSGDKIFDDVMLGLQDTSTEPSLRSRHDTSNYAPNSISSGYVNESVGSESGSYGARHECSNYAPNSISSGYVSGSVGSESGSYGARHECSNYAPNSISSGYVSGSVGSESGSYGASHECSNYAPNSISSGYVSGSVGSESGSCGASSNYIIVDSEHVSSCSLQTMTAVIELAESNDNTEAQTLDKMTYSSRLQLTSDELQSKQLQECQEHEPTHTCYWKTFDEENTTGHNRQHGTAPNTDKDTPITSNCSLPHYVNCPKDSVGDIETCRITFDISI